MLQKGGTVQAEQNSYGKPWTGEVLMCSSHYQKTRESAGKSRTEVGEGLKRGQQMFLTGAHV